MKVEELANTLDPRQTTLLFGAGASIPSGAPCGAEIARRLRAQLTTDLEDADLAEVAQVLEDKKGRLKLVAEKASTVSKG